MPDDETAGNAIAFFDVDGTIVDATVVHYYAYFARKEYGALKRALWTAAFLPRVAYYLILDKISRSRFNSVFYRNYRHFDADQCRAWSRNHFEDVIRPRLFPDAVDRIRRHRKNGERVVLVTGSLDFIIQPLADYLEADELIAVSMHEDNGRLTGELTGPPIGDEEKARIIKKYAEDRQIDLAQCHAYADSSSDLPMLQAVGTAVAVNPKGTLKEAAEARGWEVSNWEVGKGSDE